jgi:hypothetical protein
MLIAALVTSVAAGLVVRRAAPPARSLRRAALLVLELVGLATVFVVGNLVLAAAIVLAIRTLSSHFVSIYVLDDLALVALSLLQGAVFFFWRRRL